MKTLNVRLTVDVVFKADDDCDFDKLVEGLEVVVHDASGQAETEDVSVYRAKCEDSH